MRNWFYFITLFMITIAALFIMSNLYGCVTLKESFRATKLITTADKIDKKIKEKEKTNEEKEKENIIACIKLQPECEQ